MPGFRTMGGLPLLNHTDGKTGRGSIWESAANATDQLSTDYTIPAADWDSTSPMRWAQEAQWILSSPITCDSSSSCAAELHQNSYSFKSTVADPELLWWHF